MYPDYFIYDELKRRRERDAWEPEPLHLPLYEPYTEPNHDDDSDEKDETASRGVIIIDMNDYTEIDQDDYPLA